MKKQLYISILAFLFAFGWLGVAGGAESDVKASTESDTESKEEVDVSFKIPFETRAKWWNHDKFGLFIHWGPYSILAGNYKGKDTPGEAEWIMKGCKIPIDEYTSEVAAKWNPTLYNPKEWAQWAKEAGMTYIVLTTKHHDGFALFDSKVSTYDMVDHSPYGKDAIREYVDACRAENLKVGFYYSGGWDWHYGTGNDWDPNAADVDIDKYIDEKAVPQVRELFTNYGKVDILFWDMPAKIITSRDRAVRLASLYKLQPEMLVNNRLGGGLKGDFDTPEQHVPNIRHSPRPWQTCMTMNGTWGYRDKGEVWKSPKELCHKLMDIVSKGGNFLLNVGPMGDGRFPQKAIDRLKAVGSWIRHNAQGEHVYGSTFVFREMPAWGRMTGRSGVIYASVFEWPQDGELFLPGVGGTVHKAYLLRDPSRTFKTEQQRDGTLLRLTGDPIDKIASVVKLEYEGEPEIWEVHLRPDETGVFDLPVSLSDPSHKSIRQRTIDGKVALEGWPQSHHDTSWPLDIPAPGCYAVSAVYAACAEQEGNTFRVQLDDDIIKPTVKNTESRFVETSLGNITFKSAGKQRIHVGSESVANNRTGLMSLHRLILQPLPK